MVVAVIIAVLPGRTVPGYTVLRFETVATDSPCAVMRFPKSLLSDGPAALRWAATAFLVASVASCSGGSDQGPPGSLSGQLVLAPGQFVPVGMPFEVELIEHPAPAEGAGPIAVQTLESGEAPETPFALEYGADKVKRGTQYVLRAKAVLNNTVYLAGEAPAPVPSVQPPIPVDIVLRPLPDAAPLFRQVSIMRLGYKREVDWARQLRDVMPAIQICLRSVSGESLEVTKAWPMGGGKAGVRIRSADGSGFDCTALVDGSKFTSLSGLPSFAENLPGERGPVFIPAPRGPRAMECQRYERVMGGFNESLGWLVYPTCPGEAPAAQ
jgi:hypothetical protein